MTGPVFSRATTIPVAFIVTRGARIGGTVGNPAILFASIASHLIRANYM
jgi:hypothetical protein